MTNAQHTTATSERQSLHERAGAAVEREISALLDELDGSAPLLHRMARYHFGLVTPAGAPVPPEEQARFHGKRMRPLLAVLACVAAGGTITEAAPLAAAIELLHNFTLIHDDIQDRSPNRRHRAAVWRVWGDAQAINAGDGLFAAAQIGVLRSASPRIGAEQQLEIARAFNRMTIDIVRGQVLDLGFEGQSATTPDEYLAMIRGKTAAIVQFSAWAGALLGGADSSAASVYGRFGEALGLGFQIRDDALGIWGVAAETGKDTADDIRRRKQSLPLLLLREAATDADREALQTIFGGDRVTEEDVTSVLAMLERYGIEAMVETRVRTYHRDAVLALDALAPSAEPIALAALRALTSRMSNRSA